MNTGQNEESTMISKMFRIALTIILASFALSSAFGAATCSNASLSGTYGFLGEGTNTKGELLPASSSGNLTHPQASLQERQQLPSTL